MDIMVSQECQATAGQRQGNGWGVSRYTSSLADRHITISDIVKDMFGLENNN